MMLNLKTLPKNDMVFAFIVAVLWQLVMTIIGILLHPAQSGESFLQHMILWDGNWYVMVIKEHYLLNPASPAFYPLFPLIIGILSFVTFHTIDIAVLALLVNTVALGFAIAALLAVAKHFNIPARLRYLCVAIFLLSPATFFMHLFYGEAVFVALGFWAYVFTLRKQWLYMGLLLALLTASRLPSLLFVGLCGLEYLRSYDWNLKKALNPNLLSFLIAPIGFITYGFYLLAIRGDFFAMFSAYNATDDWKYHSFEPNFVHTIARAAYQVIRALLGVRPFDNDIFVNHAIPLLCIVLLLACSLYLVFKYKNQGIPLGIAGLCSIVFFTLNNNLVSAHRYTLPCLGIYICLALIYAHYPRWRPVVFILGLIMLIIQAILVVILYSSRSFVG